MTGDAAAYARRAVRAHAALRLRFEHRDGMLRRDGRLHLPGTVAHLWPFARAFVATLDVAGMAVGAPPAAEPDALIARRLSALERYRDAHGPAYASDPPGGRIGGDVYYDDNAWVGLALCQLERMRPGTGRLDHAARIAGFARGGWDEVRGGVYWVAQGRGIGARNHDRNAISTAPNAQVMLHLSALGAGADGAEPTPARCAEWVTATLTGPGGLIRDKVRGDGSVDVATWTYNQGSMIGLHVQLARDGGAGAGSAPGAAAGPLAAARELAERALDHYASTGYAGEPDEFVAILARNLLLLHAALPESDPLRERILATVRERADASWARGDPERHGTLLAHSARVSLHALAAWDPGDFGRLA